MIKLVIGGAVAAALLCGPAYAAASAKSPSKTGALWVVAPTETGCRTEIELKARSGAVTPVSLVSDGQIISLRFFKSDLPTRAFLPVRVNGARFSNLMLRGTDGSGELVLSEETEAAMRKGLTLDIAWLTDEPLSTPLGGSEQGLTDLRVCGAQTATRHRERAITEQAERERAQAAARAKTLNDAQLAAVKAQAAAAEAQRRQVEETAQRQRRADAAEQARLDRDAQQRAYADQRQTYGYSQTPAYYDQGPTYADQQRANYEAQRRRAYEAARREEEDDRWYPPAPPPRAYYLPVPRYPYPRY